MLADAKPDVAAERVGLLWGQSPQANKRLWGQSPQANKRDLLEIVSAPIHSVDNQWLDVKGVGLHFSKSM
jgi:hypothetical protein